MLSRSQTHTQTCIHPQLEIGRFRLRGPRNMKKHKNWLSESKTLEAYNCTKCKKKYKKSTNQYRL